MKKLAAVGRILFALPFGIMGLNHFLLKDLLLAKLTTYIPGGGFTFLLVGAMLVIASVSIILNKYVTIACYWLAGLLFLFIVTIYIPQLYTDNWQIALIQIVTHSSLLGATIMIAYYLDMLNKGKIVEEKDKEIK